MPLASGYRLTVTGVAGCKDSSAPTLKRSGARNLLRAALKKAAHTAEGDTEHMHDQIRILMAIFW